MLLNRQPVPTRTHARGGAHVVGRPGPGPGPTRLVAAPHMQLVHLGICTHAHVHRAVMGCLVLHAMRVLWAAAHAIVTGTAWMAALRTRLRGRCAPSPGGLKTASPAHQHSSPWQHHDCVAVLAHMAMGVWCGAQHTLDSARATQPINNNPAPHLELGSIAWPIWGVNAGVHLGLGPPKHA